MRTKFSFVCLGLLAVVYACGFVGKGTWSDNRGNSGSFKSKLSFKFVELPSGEESEASVYKIKFSDGSKEVIKFISPDEDSDTKEILSPTGEVIGKVTNDSDYEVFFVFEIDGEKIELHVMSAEQTNVISVTGTKTYLDGRVLTWNDTLIPDRATQEVLDEYGI